MRSKSLTLKSVLKLLKSLNSVDKVIVLTAEKIHLMLARTLVVVAIILHSHHNLQNQPPPLLDYQPSQVLQPAPSRPVTSWQFAAKTVNGKDPPIEIPREFMSLSRFIKTCV